MFSGIVQSIGVIEKISPLGTGSDAGVHLRICAPEFPMDKVKLGDSIAIQGACMTVVGFNAQYFEVDVSRESLNKTRGLDTLGEVNLEPSLRMGDTIDGHMVSGHVDGIAKVASFERVGESHELQIQIPTEFAMYMAYKGSVAVNGVSLTVNKVTDNADGCVISINIIPHTLAVTSLKNLHADQFVNIEVDTLARYTARYAERMLQYRS